MNACSAIRTVPTCVHLRDRGRTATASMHAPPLFLTLAGYSSCAMTAAGLASCWGRALAGSPSLAGLSGISPSPYYTCSLASASISCFPMSANSTADSLYTVNLAASVPMGVSAASQVAVVTNDYHACVLSSAGRVFCWGRNSEGQTTVPESAAAVGGVAIPCGVPSPSSTPPASPSRFAAATAPGTSLPTPSPTRSVAPFAGPLLAWRFQNDLTSYGSASSAATALMPFNGPTFVAGVAGGMAVRLSTQRGSYLYSAPLAALPSGAQPRSVAVWLRGENNYDDAVIAAWGLQANATMSALFAGYFFGFCGFYWDLHGPHPDPVSAVLLNGDWHHIAFSFNGSLMITYKDGAVVASSTRTINEPNVVSGPLSSLATTPQLGALRRSCPCPAAGHQPRLALGLHRARHLHGLH